MNYMSNPENIKVSIPLGNILTQNIFTWITLRKSYSNTARMISLGWLILGVLLLALLPTPTPAAIQKKIESEVTGSADVEAARIRKQFQDRKADYEDISKGAEFDAISFEKGININHTHCGEQICRYLINR